MKEISANQMIANATRMVQAKITSKRLNIEERDLLLTELMCTYINGCKSQLMECVLNNDLDGFRRLHAQLHEDGVALTQTLGDGGK